MIHIIDNGYDYSNHSIYFVETSVSAEELAALFPHLNHRRTRDAVIATADRLEWRDGGSSQTLGQYIEPDMFEEDVYAEGWLSKVSAEALVHTSPAIARELLSDWAKMPNGANLGDALEAALKERAG